MPKREAELRSQLMVVLKRHAPELVAFRHESVRECGIPDLSLTGGGITTWWEFKHATPRFDDNGLQLLTCARLAVGGFCRYVLWRENANGTGKQTMLVHPRHVKTMRDQKRWDFVPDASTENFDHPWLVAQMLFAHRLG